MDSLQEVAAMAFLSVDDENAFNSLPSSMQKYVASVYFSRSFAEFSEELEVTIASAIDPDSSPVDQEFLKSEVNKFILMSSVCSSDIPSSEASLRNVILFLPEMENILHQDILIKLIDSLEKLVFQWIDWSHVCATYISILHLMSFYIL